MSFFSIKLNRDESTPLAERTSHTGRRALAKLHGILTWKTLVWLLMALLFCASLLNPGHAFADMRPDPRLDGVQQFAGCDAVAGVSVAECEALVALYNLTNGPNWSDSGGWLATNEPCNWSGVSCGENGIHELWLDSRGLNGAIPPQVGNLVHLEILALFNNQLSGEIPVELGALTSLRFLFLDGNSLSGSIPTALGNLPHLEILNLHLNQLSGPVPPQLGNNAALHTLNLYNNDLSGNLPALLGNLTFLRELNLTENRFTGPIPEAWGNMQRLEVLNVSRNDLSGELPASLQQLSNLRLLEIHNNNLSGGLPGWVGNLSNLEQILIDSNNFAGALPMSLTGLSPTHFNYNDTQLCRPDHSVFENWLAGIANRNVSGLVCEPSDEPEEPVNGTPELPETIIFLPAVAR